jgi:hypothetical protein
MAHTWVASEVAPLTDSFSFSEVGRGGYAGTRLLAMSHASCQSGVVRCVWVVSRKRVGGCNGGLACMKADKWRMPVMTASSTYFPLAMCTDRPRWTRQRINDPLPGPLIPWSPRPLVLPFISCRQPAQFERHVSSQEGRGSLSRPLDVRLPRLIDRLWAGPAAIAAIAA